MIIANRYVFALRFSGDEDGYGVLVIFEKLYMSLWENLRQLNSYGKFLTRNKETIFVNNYYVHSTSSFHENVGYISILWIHR